MHRLHSGGFLSAFLSGSNTPVGQWYTTATTCLTAHTDRVSPDSTEVMWPSVIWPTALWRGKKERSDLSCQPVIWSGTAWIAIPGWFCMGAQQTVRHNGGLVSYSDSRSISPSFNYRQEESANICKKLMTKPWRRLRITFMSTVRLLQQCLSEFP